MKFSIIVVALNPGDALLYTLESILKQTYTDFEVIVKDGGSTDGSMEKLPQDLRIHLVQKKDSGIYDAMNQAVAESKGEFINFMNCGDRFNDEFVLEKVSGFIEKRVKFAEDEEPAENNAITTPNEKSDGTNVITTLKEESAGNNETFSKVILYGDTYSKRADSVKKAYSKITPSVCYRYIPCHQAMFYQRQTIADRGFDTKYRIRGDHEHFLYSYFEGGVSFEYLDFPVCEYEGGGVSENKKNNARNKAEYNEIVKKYIPFKTRFLERARLILTLQKVREKMANSKTFGKFYEKIRNSVKA